MTDEPDEPTVIGRWIVRSAEEVHDMGDRVQRVLTENPRDHHYAASKLSHALYHAAAGMVLAGAELAELTECVERATRATHRDLDDLRRERDLAEAS